MKTIAARLYGANDVRIEQFELPNITEDEVLIKVVSDSVCTSTYKAIVQGTAHKRVPENIATHPVIIGHELCGEVVEAGENQKEHWKPGQKVVLQPALKLPNGHDPGYSYPYIGGNTQYAIVPKVVLERNCLIPFTGDSFFEGSLLESLACVIRGFKGLYHTDYRTYTRTDGAKKHGRIAILGGAGPMGIGAAELSVGYAKAKQVVVTDIDEKRLAVAEQKCSPSNAASRGAELIYLNTAGMENAAEKLLEISKGGFDDVFVMVPVANLFTLAEKICREDGCINFFAGPPVHDLPGFLNLYRVHYDGIHLVGTAGSITEDMVDIIHLLEEKSIHSGTLVSHILGLKALPQTLFDAAKPNGAKKVCYNDLDIPLVALSDLEELGKTDPLYRQLDLIVKENGGLWCGKAEAFLLANAPRI